MIEEKQLKAITEIKKFHQISDNQVKKLNEFVDLLIKCNQEYNLIGKSTIDDIWYRHILDSAQLIQYIDNKNAIVGDFGSGAGLPAIVLSILGICEIHLIEKSFRKCEFLHKAAEISGNKVVIHQKKAEEISGLKIDIATSRAFAPLDDLIKFVKPFLRDNAYGIFPKGKSFEAEINLAKKHNKFKFTAHTSLTSPESKVLIINNIN